MNLGVAWYRFKSSLICNINVPLKQPIPKNVTIIIVHFFCYFSSGWHVCFFSRASNKVVTFLFILYSNRILFESFHLWDFSCLNYSFLNITKKLHGNSMCLCLNVTLHMLYCGILELLYIHNLNLCTYLIL